MTVRFTILFLVLLALFSTSTFAQQFGPNTKVEVVYWRAFAGTIKLNISPTDDKDLAINVEITPRGNEGAQDVKRTFKKTPHRDLTSVIRLFNDNRARQFFATTPPVLQPDGSHLSITVTQNSFSITFDSQNAFDRRAPEHEATLGRIANEFFKRAGLLLAENELY
ncbi:MAG: hypothetical protein EOP84_08980 [Verrucomicrobiaceae bacterium]|nr:MAG: hypothetical protein EOP84_08980 [Verrucomicrobiaceae bacterium]